MPNITKVYLLNAPLESDYLHTLYFGSAEQQQSYFKNRIRKSYTDFSYQRKDDVMRIPEHIDALINAGCNYVMYQNAAYSNKWFYAFIENMEYINDARTDVKIRTDCMQTWMFEKVVMPCFIEREHAATDEPGDHTIDEGLELGEYHCNLHSFSDYAGADLKIVIGVTKDTEGENVQGALYNTIYSGVKYYAFGASDAAAINEFLSGYDSDGIGEAITCMFLAPSPLAKSSSGEVISTNITENYYINADSVTNNAIKTLTKGTLDDYVPRNKKLLCFPYRYLLVGNNAGASVPFRYEFFRNSDGNIIPPKFLIEGVLSPGCSIRMLPLDYDGAYMNDEHGVNMGKFPILNWTSDVYTNWLTQNGVNIAISLATGAAQFVGGIGLMAATAGAGAMVGGGTAISGASQIANTLTQVHQQSFSPPQAKGNLNSGDVVTATKRNDFHFYDMSIKREYARIIDEYFDMYGYKCHRVKKPAHGHRSSYWYTKTIDANITGNIPQQDLQVIKDCYNRGITFWRNHEAFKNYDVVNEVMNG